MAKLGRIAWLGAAHANAAGTVLAEQELEFSVRLWKGEDRHTRQLRWAEHRELGVLARRLHLRARQGTGARTSLF